MKMARKAKPRKAWAVMHPDRNTFMPGCIAYERDWIECQAKIYKGRIARIEIREISK